MGRDKEQWGEDVLDYRPERHMPSDPSYPTRSKFAWIPFGGGPRVCLGKNLAMLEARVITAALLQSFFFETNEPELEIGYDITINFPTGVAVDFRPRSGVKL